MPQLTNEELKNICFGAYSFAETEDPNCLGAETYGRNLVEAIRKICF